MPYFISSDNILINKGKNFPFIYKRIHNEINVYSFHLEKNYNLRKIILIPENNDKVKQVIITNKKFDFQYQLNIKEGESCLITLDSFYLDEYDTVFFNYYFRSFSSPIRNIKFISPDKIYVDKYFIFNHFGKKYLYISEFDKKDIYIEEKIYKPKFNLFSILNDETIDHFKLFFESKRIYMNRRINTDLILINDLINIYIDKFDIKYNLYIKKYYGKIKLYESQYELKNISNDINILMKPINNLKNKKSIFNRLIQLSQKQLITGFLSENSLLDIYLEKDNDNKDIYLYDFKNRKYLKKDIEYHIHFNLNHLIKLEELKSDTEIIIYNEDTKIFLNNKKQPGIVLGDNFKIKSNNNAMIYFYPKTKKFQIKLNPKKGEIIEIKRKTDIIHHYSIDFGFEGFEPPNMDLNYYESQLYIENIYDKLDIKLAQGEFLYIYYYASIEDIFEINYITNNIISTNFKYNFYCMKANITEAKYIISKINREETRIQINHCNPNPNKTSKININYRYALYTENQENFGEIIYNNYKLKDYEVYKFSFESQDDFVLSYSYNDSKDNFLSENENFKKERIKYDNLIINNITIINKNEIKINFNRNYKNSLTKYIIIIIPEEKNNILENIKNICFLTELINNEENNFITEEIYDIGENNYIEVNVDISKLNLVNNKIIVDIISQELRYEKFLKFYEPKIFFFEKNENRNTNIKIYIFLILGFCLFLSLVFICYKKLFKKIKAKMRKKIIYEENFGMELNDDIDFLNSKNN